MPGSFRIALRGLRDRARLVTGLQIAFLSYEVVVSPHRKPLQQVQQIIAATQRPRPRMQTRLKQLQALLRYALAGLSMQDDVFTYLTCLLGHIGRLDYARAHSVPRQHCAYRPSADAP